MIDERKQKKKNVFLVNNYEEYLRSDEPVISLEKRKIIQQKLQLQKEALAQARQRQKREDHFLKYTYNPFLNEEPKTRKIIKKEPEKNLLNKFLSLEVGDEDSDEIIAMKNQFTLEKKKALQVSIRCRIFKDVKQKQNKKGNIFDIIDIQSLFKDKTNDASIPIQEIVKIEEDNFFMKNQEKINIFKLIRDDSDKFGPQILNKYHFSQTSVVQKIQKIKVPIYRDMSQLSRKATAGISTGLQDITDYVDSYELSFKIKELLYHDLMSVGSGRFSSQFLNKVTNNNENIFSAKQMSDKSSQQSNTQTVVLHNNLKNQNCKFKDDFEEEHEIIDYMNLEYNSQQKVYDSKCKDKQSYIFNLLSQKQSLYQFTIKDNSIHNNLKSKISQGVDNFTEMDKTNIEADRIVLKNKVYKNKNQSIKYKTLLQTLAFNNNYEEVVEKRQTKKRS